MIRTYVCARERLSLRALVDMVRGDARLALVGAVAELGELAEFAPGADDVVLVWLTTDATDALQVLQRSSIARRARVVVVAPSVSRELVGAAVQAGVRGFLVGDAEPAAILEALARVHAGEAPFDPRATAWLLPHKVEPHESGLTERDQQILGLLAEGHLNREIATRLGIAEATVKANMSRIYHRLGVDNRTQAASWARANGMGVSSLCGT